MRITLLAAVALLVACSGRNPEPVDSATASDSAALPADNTAGTDPRVDTMPAYPPPDASGNLTGETRKKSGGFGQDPPPPVDRRDRDSAFGPIGTMDSLGKRDTIRR